VPLAFIHAPNVEEGRHEATTSDADRMAQELAQIQGGRTRLRKLS